MGFTSVMYDCSQETYENNIKKVADMVRDCPCIRSHLVEGELGRGQMKVHLRITAFIQKPEQAADYAERTGVDALLLLMELHMVLISRSRSFDIERLNRLRLLQKAPLVLHGGSGPSDDDFRNCTKNGVSKVNIFTDINCAAQKAVVNNYKDGNGISDLQLDVVEAVKKETMKKMLCSIEQQGIEGWSYGKENCLLQEICALI